MAKSWIKKIFQSFCKNNKQKQRENPVLSLETLESRLNPRTVISGASTLIIRCSDLTDILSVSLQGTSIVLTDTSPVPNPGNAITGTFNGTTANSNTVTLPLPNGFTGIEVFMDTTTNGSPDVLIIDSSLDFTSLNSKTFTQPKHILLDGMAPSDDDLLVFTSTGSPLTVSSSGDYCKVQNFAFMVNSINNSATIKSTVGSATGTQYLYALNQEYPRTAGMVANNQEPFISVGNVNFDGMNNGYFRQSVFNKNSTIYIPTIGQGDIRFEAAGAGNQIYLDSEIQVLTDIFLGSTTNEAISIQSNANLVSPSQTGGRLQYSFSYDNSNTLSSNPGSKMTILTSGNVTLEGSIDIKSELDVQNTNNFIIGTVGAGSDERDLRANQISIVSSTGQVNSINVSGSVQTYSGDFSLLGSGSSSQTGAKVIFCSDASFGTYTFYTAGSLIASDNGGVYDLSILANRINDPVSGARVLSAIIGTSGQGNATVQNTGNLSLGNVGNPNGANEVNQFYRVNGFFDGLKSINPITLLYGDTNIHADISVSQSFQINSRYLNVKSTTNSKTFTIQAERGDLNINGDIVLEDSPLSLNIPPDGSNLSLQAGVGNIDGGSIRVQSVDGINRNFTIVDAKNFTATGTVSVNNLFVQSNQSDANNGAGIYTFNGSVGKQLYPTGFNAAIGAYNIQFLGSANFLSPKTGQSKVEILNSGRVTLGDNANDQISFVDVIGNTSLGFFGENTFLAGTGIINGSVISYGAVTPGDFFYVDSNNNARAQDGGVLTINGSLSLQEVSSSGDPNTDKSVYYVDLFGNSPGKFQDQLSVSQDVFLTNQPILYPVMRTEDPQYGIGSQFTILNNEGQNAVGGTFFGLLNPLTDFYGTLNEGTVFYGAGSKFSISYTGGDGNDVVITYLGRAPGTYVYVDINNVLNVIGDNNSSNVTSEMPLLNSVGRVILDSTGSGYTQNPTVSFTGANTSSAKASTSLSINSFSGRILNIFPEGVNGTGNNYSVNEIVIIQGGNSSNLAQAVVNTVNNGAITSLSITAATLNTNSGYNLSNLLGLKIQSTGFDINGNKLTNPGSGGTAYSTSSQFVPINAGSGYSVNQVVTLKEGLNETATAIVSSVDASGGITSLILASDGNGIGYTNLTNLVVTGSRFSNNATLSAYGFVGQITLDDPGSGYANPPSVLINGGIPVDGNGQVAGASALLDLYLNISDITYGLNGYAYHSKAINDNLSIKVSDPTSIGKGQITGYNVEQRGGNDTLNIINNDFIKANVLNPNIENVFFSFNGGPTATPNVDSDILNIIGLSQNIETGAIGNSTILLQGYDYFRSLTTLGVETNGQLFSANQNSDSFRVLGPIYFDKGLGLNFGTNTRSSFESNNPIAPNYQLLVPNTSGTLSFANDIYLSDDFQLTLGRVETVPSTSVVLGTSYVNASTGTFTVGSNSPFYNGAPVRLAISSGGTLPIIKNGPSLVAETVTYYVIRNGSGTLQLAATPQDAQSGTAITYSNVGTGTITFFSTTPIVHSGNVTLQSVFGTSGGTTSSNIVFQVNPTQTVYNGVFTSGNSINLELPIYGGLINVIGKIGNDINLVQLDYSGFTDFRSSVDAKTIQINRNTGGVTFRGMVGANLAPSILLDDISSGSIVRFQSNLNANSITTFAKPFVLQLNGSVTNISNYSNLTNSGGIVLGDSLDTLNFLGGLEIPTTSPVDIYGKIQSTGSTINILSDNITLRGKSYIGTTLGGGLNSAPIGLGTVYTQGFALTLDAGEISGSSITIKQLRGKDGTLTIINSDGVSINQVGYYQDPNNNSAINVNTPTEVFGTITILDSANDVAFNGSVVCQNIITTDQYYNVLFQGFDTSTSITSLRNNGNYQFQDRWMFLFTGNAPMVFQNKGSVTLGYNGSDVSQKQDIFIFNGGVDTSKITGTTNVAGRIYTNNKDIVLSNVSLNKQTFLNTYLSSQAFNRYSDDAPTFLNPQIDPTSVNSNKRESYQILKLFGYPTYENKNASQSGDPANLPVLPLGTLPSSTGDIILGSIVNNNNRLEINAGGLGVYGDIVAGDINLGSYTGTGNDSLGVFRANNMTFSGNISATNLQFGTKANASESEEIGLINTVTVVGNFEVSNLLQVSMDVNNLFFAGSINNFYSENILANSGFTQLGNESTDVFNITSNFNIRGASVRKLAGVFNMADGKTMDMGPGPTSLQANTEINTSGDGRSTVGQISNNSFDINFNGNVQLQRYANDSLISPYPQNTTPPTLIPTNNLVGAGTGGGNTFFKGQLTIQNVQNNVLSSPNSINVTILNSGFVNAYPWTGFDLAPKVAINDGGGLGATADALISLVMIPGSGNKIVYGANLTDPIVNGMRLPLNRFNVSGSGYFSGDVVDILQSNLPFTINTTGGAVQRDPITGATLTPARGVVTADINTGAIISIDFSQYVNQPVQNSTVNYAGYYSSFINNNGTGPDFIVRSTSGNASATFINLPYDDIIGGVTNVTYTNRGAGYTSVPSIEIMGVTPLGTPAYRSTVVPQSVAVTTITTSTGFPVGNYINVPENVFLKKQGTGNLFLYNDNSTTTAKLVSTIENGGLFYEGAKVSSDTVTNVQNNGKIGGTSGYLGTLNILTNGTLSPGSVPTSFTPSPIGKLNVTGDLVIQGKYDVDIRSQAFNLFDQVVVDGKVQVSKSGVNGLLDVKFTPEANVQVGQMFGIIKNDGSSKVIGNFNTKDSANTTIVLTEASTFERVLPNGEVVTFKITYQGSVTANSTSFTGGNDVVLQVVSRVTPQIAVAQRKQFPLKLFAVSTDAGGGPVVRINFSDGSGFSFFAYAPTFTGGVRTAIGDINGDGQPDLVTAAGPGGGPHVIVWSINPSLSYATVQSGFFAFEPTFTGGITLSTGNLNGDTFDDIIVGAGAGGGPRVAAFAGNANYASNPTTRIADFFAYDPSFNKGVNVAAGNVASGQFDEIITGAGQGGAPHVAVWQNSAAQPLVWTKINEFFAFSPALTCGVFVGAGDLDSDGIADIYTGTGSGTIGTAGVFFGNGAVTKFEPFGQFFYGGVRVGAALGPVNQTGNTSVAQNYLIAAAGPGGGPQVSIFNGNLNLVDAFFAFPQNFTGGVLASTTVNR